MPIPAINHELLTTIFTRMCDDKTEWDLNSALYLIETETVDEYHVTPLDVMTQGLLEVSYRTGHPVAMVLDRCADIVEFAHRIDPTLNPTTKGFDFLGLVFATEAHKAPRTSPGGPPLGQPGYSNELADNPNSITIFNVTAVTIDNMIHSHTIERISREPENYCQRFTDRHETACIPASLRRMVTTIDNTPKVTHG